LALRKEEAAFMGQWGDRIGDVVYYYAPGYAEQMGINSFDSLEPELLSGSGFRPVGEGQATKFVTIQGLYHPYLPTAKYGGCSDRTVLLSPGQE